MYIVFIPKISSANPLEINCCAINVMYFPVCVFNSNECFLFWILPQSIFYLSGAKEKALIFQEDGRLLCRVYNEKYVCAYNTPSARYTLHTGHVSCCQQTDAGEPVCYRKSSCVWCSQATLNHTRLIWHEFYLYSSMEFGFVYTRFDRKPQIKNMIYLLLCTVPEKRTGKH